MGDSFLAQTKFASIESHNEFFRKRLTEEMEEAKKQETRSVKDVSLQWETRNYYTNIGIYRIPEEQENWFDGKVTLAHPRSNWKACAVFSMVKDGLLVMTFKDYECPKHMLNGFELLLEFDSFCYDRMFLALEAMADSQICQQLLAPSKVAPRLLDDDDEVELAPNMPVPNVSQSMAIRSTLLPGVHLIQGPPGTGKSFVIVHIVENLDGRVLICTPSNSAADHLTSYLVRGGVKVVRMKAKSREMETSIFEHTVVGKLRTNLAYMAAKSRIHNQTSKKEDMFYVEPFEIGILSQARVVVTTCSAGADKRLTNIHFTTVIIDEATQSIEPTTLIPISLRNESPERVILVGDHKQLQPVVLSQLAAGRGHYIAVRETYCSRNAVC